MGRGHWTRVCSNRAYLQYHRLIVFFQTQQVLNMNPYSLNVKKSLLTGIILALFTLPIHANTIQIERTAKSNLIKLYSELAKTPNLSMSARLDQISAVFLGKPYKLGALGEGGQGRYDQFPRYRDDAFDCETFVDMVLGIALSKELNDFEYCLNKIRYRQGKVDFLTRNHFTDLDWNQNNQQQGFLQDITDQIKNAHNQPVAQIATATINKPGWYAHLNEAQIKLEKATPSKQRQRLLELKNKGQALPIITSSIPYIPLTALFDAKGNANDLLFKQIPNASIIEIIRPNWDLRETIGTCLNVSHLGFAFWHDGVLIFREASSEYHQVIDVPLIDYLKKALSSPTIKGVNIQQVLPLTSKHQRC